MRYPIALALLALASIAAPADNPLSRGVTLSSSDCVTGANIIAEAAPGPVGTYMRVQHMGDPGTPELAGQVANPVTWNVGELTGFDARAFPGAQRGYRDEGLPVGTSAFQLHCDEAGFLINTWQFSHASPLFGEGPSVSVSRDMVPFAPVFRNGASLLFEADIRVPWVHNQQPPVFEGTAQVSFYLYARDSRSGKVIAQLAQVFENRPAGFMGAGVENMAYDGVVNFASSPVSSHDARGQPVRYLTVPAASPQIQYQHPWREARRFRVIVTHANFAAILADLRSRSQPELSAEPSDYEITSFGILGEVFPGTGNEHNVSLAASVARMSLRELPLPAPPPRP